MLCAGLLFLAHSCFSLVMATSPPPTENLSLLPRVIRGGAVCSLQDRATLVILPGAGKEL